MKARWLMYSCLSVATVVLWAVFLYMPEKNHQNMTAARVAEAQAQLADFQNTTNQLPLLLKAREQMDTSLQELNSKLYAKHELIRLFDQLKSDAADHDLRLQEISPSVTELLNTNSAPRSDSVPQFLNIILRMSGDYLSFGRYVEWLEHAGYFHGINRCHIASGDKNTPAVFVVGVSALLAGVPEDK
ncbi:MAG TPA: hypothetical protein VMS71_06585 [Candidatus Acidoferrum sp.]|nr:hypothetical protein [Candidatus Acidoferrum sp.]